MSHKVAKRERRYIRIKAQAAGLIEGRTRAERRRTLAGGIKYLQRKQ